MTQEIIKNFRLRKAIFCGYFDPVHAGHKQVITHALNSTLFDEIQIIPFCKKNKSYTDFHDRLVWCIKIFSDIKNVVVHCNDAEIENNHTDLYNFLCENMDTTSQYYLIIGANAYQNMHTWKNIDEIEKLVEFCVVPRIGYYVTGTHCFTNYIPNSISSSTIRESISHLSENTLKIISNEKLYCTIGDKKK